MLLFDPIALDPSGKTSGGAFVPNLPPTLVTAGEYDSRVDPLHVKKFVAAVQNHVGQIDPFLLYMDFDSGNGYGKSKEQTIRDLEYEMRFVFARLGVR